MIDEATRRRGRRESTRNLKIHLKSTVDDRLALCGMSPDKAWVLLDCLNQPNQPLSSTVCQVCIKEATLDQKYARG
jgi:hypothetical protein